MSVVTPKIDAALSAFRQRGATTPEISMTSERDTSLSEMAARSVKTVSYGIVPKLTHLAGSRAVGGRIMIFQAK